MARVDELIPDRKVAPIINLLGLGIPQASANAKTANRRAELGGQAEALRPLLEQFGPDTAQELGLGLLSGNPQLAGNSANQLLDLQQRRAGGSGSRLAQEAEQQGARVEAFADVPQTREQELGRLQAEASLAQTEQATDTAAANQRFINARINQMPMDQAIAAGKAQREMDQLAVKNNFDFQTAVENNTVLKKGAQSFIAFNQLEDLLTGEFSPQDLAAATVAFSQILEPGLAVRNDDRVAFEQGISTGMQRIMRTVNLFSSGDIPDRDVIRQRIAQSAQSLMGDKASAILETRGFWEEKGRSIPGVTAGSVDSILGLTPASLQRMRDIAEVEVL